MTPMCPGGSFARLPCPEPPRIRGETGGHSMRIATFNINGIKARVNALQTWLQEAQPDVALLQEIKSVDENFPRELFDKVP